MKEWTQEQKDEARKLIAEKWGTPKCWPFETDYAVTLQLELSEAVELLRVYAQVSYRELQYIDGGHEAHEQSKLFLARNSPAPQESETR